MTHCSQPHDHWHCPSCKRCTDWHHACVIAVAPDGWRKVCLDCGRHG